MQAERSALLVSSEYQLHKQGLREVCRVGNAIRVIEPRTMKRARQVVCIGEKRNVCRVRWGDLKVRLATSSSSYWASVANAPNVQQPYWLIVLPLDVPDLTASLLL